MILKCVVSNFSVLKEKIIFNYVSSKDIGNEINTNSNTNQMIYNQNNSNSGTESFHSPNYVN